MDSPLDDFTNFYLGKCCSRSCYYISLATRTQFCPYCSGELKPVYNYYGIFDLQTEYVEGWRGAVSENLVKRKYKELSQLYHPDKREDGEEAFLLLGEAKAILLSASRRPVFDNLLQRAIHSRNMSKTTDEDPPSSQPPPESSVPDKAASQNVPLSREALLLQRGLLAFSLLVAGLALAYFLFYGHIGMAVVFATIVFILSIGYRRLHQIYAALFAVILCGSFLYAMLTGSEIWTLLSFVFFAGFLLFCDWLGKRWKKMHRKNASADDGKQQQSAKPS